MTLVTSHRAAINMIAICTNPFRDINFELAIKAQDILQNAGYETIICKVFGEGEEVEHPDNIDVKDIQDIKDCQLAVVIGGDGTILSVCRKLKESDVPIFGVNLGTLGFMASIEPDHIEDVLKAAEGKYFLEKRMMLDVDLIRDGQVILTDKALNDAVIHGYGDCITISAKSGECNITKFAGDGIIVSTATGSTGYSLSAGGPILEPDIEGIVITPICPHVYGARSFVLKKERVIQLQVERLHDRHAFVSVDGGKVADILPGDILQVKKSDSYTYMAFLDSNSFFDNAYDKLT